MNNHPFASTPQPSVGSNYPVLETVSSPISPYPNTSCTLQQLAGGSTPPPQKTVCVNTFVHKLYNMVIDNQYQHLIAWNYLGSSFIVCNIMEFSKDVLPKHFKHNNFSSFVRQLNMYGFHKVNKSPRGHRTLAENQIWEFSHSKFLRNRSDLLDDIKRKTMESDPARREGSDLQAHVAMIQMSQSDMMQQVGHLFENFHQVSKELVDIKKKYTQQQTMFRHMMQYIIQQNGGHVPPELCSELLRYQEQLPPPPPSIFVSSHDSQTSAMQDFRNPFPPTQVSAGTWSDFASQSQP
ncbi:HSF-type DNA-binding-domain-containing protein [Spinellus fusiger]|nr:HSF-type DNA-binding-domain-containing protein [Spinellus fusiger]